MKNTFSSIYIIILSITFNFYGQTKSLEDSITTALEVVNKAYILYDKELFNQAKEILDKIYSNNKNNYLALYYLTYIEFRLVEMSLTNSNEEFLFSEYYEKGIDHSKLLSENNILGTEGKILQAGFYLFKIAKEISSIQNLYPTIMSLLAEVEKTEPDNPRTKIILGRIKFNTPPEFGGGIEEALIYFNSAINTFESNDSPNQSGINWGYLDALIWSGQIYDRMGNIKELDVIIDKIYKVTPNFVLLRCVVPQK